MSHPLQTGIPSVPILKEGAGYVIVGLTQLLIDWLIFVLLSLFGLIVVAGNLISRIAGASIGFWLNRSWTFQTKTDHCLNQQVARFTAWWLISTLVSTGLVQMANHFYGLH